MTLTWDARSTDGNLSFCIEVVSGPQILSIAGLIYNSHKNQTSPSLASFKEELWGISPPHNKKCGIFQVPNDRFRIIAVNASKMPGGEEDQPSELKCALFHNGSILPAIGDQGVVNQNSDGSFDWVDFMTVAAPTNGRDYNTAVTWVRS